MSPAGRELVALGAVDDATAVPEMAVEFDAALLNGETPRFGIVPTVIVGYAPVGPDTDPVG